MTTRTQPIRFRPKAQKSKLARLKLNNYSWEQINSWSTDDLVAVIQIYCKINKDLPTIFKRYNYAHETDAIKLDLWYYFYVHNRIVPEERAKLDALLIPPINTLDMNLMRKSSLPELCLSWAVRTGFKTQLIFNRGMLIALHLLSVKNISPWKQFFDYYSEELFVRLMSQPISYLREGMQNLQLAVDKKQDQCELSMTLLQHFEDKYNFIVHGRNKFMARKMLDYLLETDPSRLEKVVLRIRSRLENTPEPTKPKIYNGIIITDLIWYYWTQLHASVEQIEELWKTRDHHCLNSAEDATIKL